jgi:hypothetical protein
MNNNSLKHGADTLSHQDYNQWSESPKSSEGNKIDAELREVVHVKKYFLAILHNQASATLRLVVDSE